MSRVVFVTVLLCLIAQCILAGSSRISNEKQNLRRHVSQTASKDIVPIVECVDIKNNAYFTYENNFGAPATVTLSDLNRLTPLNIAPITNFVNGSGPAFPFSQRISLSGFENDTLTWNLEYYTLPFTVTPALACPPVFNLTLLIKLNHMEVTPEISAVVGIFASLTGVSQTRVAVADSDYTGPPAKRSLTSKRGTMYTDSSLEVELQVTDGNSSEPTAAEAIADFVENQKQQEMTQAIRDQGAPSANITIVDPKSAEPPAIRGQILPPVTPPTPEPTAAPKAAPISVPVSAPIASITSVSPLTLVANFILIAVATVASLTLL
jgi:hypothetical protein